MASRGLTSDVYIEFHSSIRWGSVKDSSPLTNTLNSQIYLLKGWTTRQIFFGLSESESTYLSRIKVHTEQGM